MDADEDLGLDKLFSEEVLGIIMTEPIDPALYNINVEAELATRSTEQRKEEELDEPTEPAQSSLPNSKRMKLSSSSASTYKQVRAFAPQLTKNEMEKLKSAIPNTV